MTDHPTDPRAAGAWYAMLAPGDARSPRPLPPLPPFDPQAADEPPAEYGLRALLFVLTHDHAIGVPSAALELAQYAAPLATAHTDISPIAAQTIARAVSQIGSTLRARAALDADSITQAAQDAPGAPAGRDKPNAGPGAPLSPQPTPRPPQGSVATPPAADARQTIDAATLKTIGHDARAMLREARPAPAPVLSRADFDF